MAATDPRRPPLRLRLYVAGNSLNSARAVSNARALCVQYFEHAHELEIVDMLAFPRRALADGVIVTPTLLKLCAPTGRVIGDLSDTRQVMLVLRRE